MLLIADYVLVLKDTEYIYFRYRKNVTTYGSFGPTNMIISSFMADEIIKNIILPNSYNEKNSSSRFYRA